MHFLVTVTARARLWAFWVKVSSTQTVLHTGGQRAQAWGRARRPLLSKPPSSTPRHWRGPGLAKLCPGPGLRASHQHTPRVLCGSGFRCGLSGLSRAKRPSKDEKHSPTQLEGVRRTPCSVKRNGLFTRESSYCSKGRLHYETTSGSLLTKGDFGQFLNGVIYDTVCGLTLAHSFCTLAASATRQDTEHRPCTQGALPAEQPHPRGGHPASLHPSKLTPL